MCSCVKLLLQYKRTGVCAFSGWCVSSPGSVGGSSQKVHSVTGKACVQTVCSAELLCMLNFAHVHGEQDWYCYNVVPLFSEQT